MDSKMESKIANFWSRTLIFQIEKNLEINLVSNLDNSETSNLENLKNFQFVKLKKNRNFENLKKN